MSQTIETDAGTGDAPPEHEDVLRVARANGWKPKDEFKGKPDDWISASVFVSRGLENPAILAKQNGVLVDRIDRLERVHQRTTTDLTAKLDEAVTTVASMTGMLRTADQRAFERARRELKDQQTAAVESGDTATFRRIDGEIEELDKTRPAPVTTPVRTERQTQVNGASASWDDVGDPNNPHVQKFLSQNAAWYDPSLRSATADQEMMRHADTLIAGVRAARPDVPLDQALEYVNNEVRARFPGKFRNGEGNGIGGQRSNGHDRQDNQNDRQDDSPAVTPSSGGTPRRAAARNTFDAMPKESKDAYVKYANMLKGKGEPLTKDEWAASYWEQFKDDGT